MRVQFGFVAMALSLQNASVSQTMTLKTFRSITDREAALRKATRTAEQNLANTLRVLRHAAASGIQLYRFSSKLIPLYGLPETQDWDFIGKLHDPLKKVGDFVQDKKMRVSFHPDHFVVLNSPSRNVFQNSVSVLQYHLDLLQGMGLGTDAKLVLHIGGRYSDKQIALARFLENWRQVPENIKQRLILENDDKIFTARDVEGLCSRLCTPMVLDVHHHNCNFEDGASLEGVLQPFLESWRGSGRPPKAHFSSPKNAKNFRAHADFINPTEMVAFLNLIRASSNTDLDIMLEAKRKDEAVFALVKELQKMDGVKVRSEGAIDYKP